MALKDTISKWHASVCYLEDGFLTESIEKFLQINNPSAKITYNVGCVYMILDDIEQALQYFSASIDKDRYLAIAYFLRGVCHCRCQRYELAHKDFSGILASLPKEGINYQQLGAAVSLDGHMIREWLQASEYVRKWKTSFPSLQPMLNYVFRPPKKMVASLKKEDFLGRAKVISSVQENDILYAEEKKSPTTPPNARRLAAPPIPAHPRKTRAIPPPPVRRPPHLTASVREKCQRRWKSMELLSGNEEESFYSEAPSDVRDSCYLLAKAADDIHVKSAAYYSELSMSDQNSVRRYEPLMMGAWRGSCPHIKTPPVKRPLLPPRPKVVNTSHGEPESPTSLLAANSSVMANHNSHQERRVPMPSSYHSRVAKSVSEPPMKPLRILGSEKEEEASKSVLARAHPSLFQAIPSPSNSHAQVVDARDQTVKMTERRQPDVTMQRPALPQKPTNSKVQNKVKDTRLSPKPPRPPPPKTFK